MSQPSLRTVDPGLLWLSAFFNRIETRKTGRKGEIVVWMNDEGDVRHPATDEIVEPWVPGSHQLDLVPDLDRRRHLSSG